MGNEEISRAFIWKPIKMGKREGQIKHNAVREKPTANSKIVYTIADFMALSLGPLQAHHHHHHVIIVTLCI